MVEVVCAEGAIRFPELCWSILRSPTFNTVINARFLADPNLCAESQKQWVVPTLLNELMRVGSALIRAFEGNRELHEHGFQHAFFGD